MPTDDHLAWFILGVIAVLITHVVRDGVESFLKWRSDRRYRQIDPALKPPDDSGLWVHESGPGIEPHWRKLGDTLRRERVMRNPDEKLVIFSDGRPALTRRDLTYDNPQTMRREHFNIDRTEVTSWVSMEAIEQSRVHRPEIAPWGTYVRCSDSGWSWNMSLFEDIFGKGEAWYGGPVGPLGPQLTGADLEIAARAAALHPGADPYFNLHPTIEMLRTADLYGFKVSRS